MTSATAVVQTGTSLRKRTGEPLNDGHRTLDYFARRLLAIDRWPSSPPSSLGSPPPSPPR
eukprot:4255322-Amphidinium_carterae.2